MKMYKEIVALFGSRSIILSILFTVLAGSVIGAVIPQNLSSKPVSILKREGFLLEDKNNDKNKIYKNVHKSNNIKNQSTTVNKTNSSTLPTPTFIQASTINPIPTAATLQNSYNYLPQSTNNQLQDTHSDAYWDWKIKQAEKEAEEGRKALDAYNQQCAELKKQRNDALSPVQAQINEIDNKLAYLYDDIIARTQGTFTSQSQLDRMYEAEKNTLLNERNKKVNELNQLSDKYPSCY